MAAEQMKDSPVDALQTKLATAEAEMDALSRKTAEYIEAVQPQLDKQAQFETRFDKRATEIAGVLVGRGIIPAGESQQLIEKLASDRVLALDLVGRLAQMIGPDRLGKQADVSVPTGRQLDAFEALVLTGDPTNTHGTTPLNVE